MILDSFSNNIQLPDPNIIIMLDEAESKYSLKHKLLL